MWPTHANLPREIFSYQMQCLLKCWVTMSTGLMTSLPKLSHACDKEIMVISLWLSL